MLAGRVIFAEVCPTMVPACCVAPSIVDDDTAFNWGVVEKPGKKRLGFKKIIRSGPVTVSIQVVWLVLKNKILEFWYEYFFDILGRKTRWESFVTAAPWALDSVQRTSRGIELIAASKLKVVFHFIEYAMVQAGTGERRH